MNIEMLDETGFVSFPYPPDLRKAVHTALESWKYFCELPMEKKRLLSRDDRDRVVDFGYMLRDDKGARADDKEQFHALRANYPALLSKAEKIDEPRAVEFITAADILIEHMRDTVELFTRKFATRYKVHGLLDEVMNSFDYCTFRFLRYPKGKPILAHAHADRGGFSFHLCETEGGGEYYGFDRIWRPWPVSEAQTIIFPSMGLQYRSYNQVKALYHRVLPLQTEQQERYAMVAFIDFQMSHRFDDTSWRIQDLEEGFNYKMPYDEFKKFFVPRTQSVPG